jgi:hypothetical protein
MWCGMLEVGSGMVTGDGHNGTDFQSRKFGSATKNLGLFFHPQLSSKSRGVSSLDLDDALMLTSLCIFVSLSVLASCLWLEVPLTSSLSRGHLRSCLDPRPAKSSHFSRQSSLQSIFPTFEPMICLLSRMEGSNYPWQRRGSLMAVRSRSRSQDDISWK